MNPVKPLPAGRTLEQVQNHYRVEKSIADRLKGSSREERKRIYASMYDELFAQVPDHPRLTRRTSAALTANANAVKFSILDRFLNPSAVFVEFACGDGRFAFEVAKRVKQAYGVDISHQGNPADTVPENFELIVYDGYNLDGIASGTVDIVFSDQLIEHLHPEDTRFHFELVHRLLKDGGRYVFRTPHYLTGPHDVSQYFSHAPEGFHLKEWSYGEIRKLLGALGYSGFRGYWNARGVTVRMPYAYFALNEGLFGLIGQQHSRAAVKYLMPAVIVEAIK